MNEFSLSRATSFLPHVQLPVPFRLAPRRSLRVYIDSELGLPLNFRESETQKFFLSKLTDYTIIFDVGSHIGTYTILATQLNDVEVHSFEAHPVNYRRLQENITRNNVEDRVSLFSGAVTESNQNVDLFIGESDTTHSTNSREGEKITVEGITLDSYCERNCVYPDLIKIDVEGAGMDVLRGASVTTEKNPDWLVETHSQQEQEFYLDFFETYGYETSRVAQKHYFASKNK
jgi:FkbM family methyltransferase